MALFFRSNKIPLINKVNKKCDKWPSRGVSDGTNIKLYETLVNCERLIRHELSHADRGSLKPNKIGNTK